MTRNSRHGTAPGRAGAHRVSRAVLDGSSTLRRRGWFGAKGARVLSLLSVAGLMAGLVVAGAFSAAAPANAAANDYGYYTSTNGISGFCVDPSLTPPNVTSFEKGPNYGGGASKVLSWFATHYGPLHNDPGGRGGYHPSSADPRVTGLTGVGADSGVAVTTAIGRDMVLAEGSAPIHGTDDTFTTQLLAFARAHPGPWDLKIALDSGGPYTPGTTYHGHLQISDADGHQVPVAGINISIGDHPGVSIDLGSHETDNNGTRTFTFSPTRDGTFAGTFSTDDVAGRAPIYQATSNPGHYQRILVPGAQSSNALLHGATRTVTTGAFAIAKLNETGLKGLAGAQFTIINADPDPAKRHVFDVITTADGSGAVPVGVAVSNVPLPVGAYYVVETQAPPGYLLPTTFTPGNEDAPFDGTESLNIKAGEFTASFFSDKPKPGQLTIHKSDAGSATFKGLAGAVFRITNAAGGSLDVTTGADGLATQTGLGAGSYTVQEITPPPGYSLNSSPQIVQVIPDGNTDVQVADTLVPALSTQVSSQNSGVGQAITDNVTVTNLGSNSAQVIWVLSGPLAPATDANGAPSCAGLNWTSAPKAKEDVITATGSGTYTTQPYTITATGCYTYTESLVANATTAGAGPTAAGLVNETTLVWEHQPKLSTQTSKQTALKGDTITDTVKVTDSLAYRGPIKWQLLGPVTPAKDVAGKDTCAGVTWTGAATAAHGTFTSHGDDTYTTTGYKVVAYGCYTYAEQLVGDTHTAPASSVAGLVSETTLAAIRHPEVTTQVSTQNASKNDTISDNIVVTGSGGYNGPVKWTLLGPVAPINRTTCVGVSWAGAPVAATGTVTAHGDATYTTTGFKVVTEGCYTYTELLVGNDTTAPAGPSVPGAVSETTLVGTHPSVTTQISTQSALVGSSIVDHIIVTGASGYQGPVNWTLYGPVAPVKTSTGALSCAKVKWAGAPVAATGSVTANGDATYTTSAYVVKKAGCYTYTELLVGNDTTIPTGPSSPGATSETVIVFVHQPVVSTQISKQEALVGDSIFDHIKVTGSFGYRGPVIWNLLGPVAPIQQAGGGLTCVGVDWTGASVAAVGSVLAHGDATYVTAPYQVKTAGCYTYVEMLTGSPTTAPTGPSSPGERTETVVVTSPPAVHLAKTGSDVTVLSLLGGGLLAAGGALMLAARRRRRTVYYY